MSDLAKTTGTSPPSLRAFNRALDRREIAIAELLRHCVYNFDATLIKPRAATAKRPFGNFYSDRVGLEIFSAAVNELRAAQEAVNAAVPAKKRRA